MVEVGGVYTSDEAESARMGQGMGYKKVLKYVQLNLSVLVYLWCSQTAMMHDLTLFQARLLRKDDSRTAFEDHQRHHWHPLPIFSLV
jgi:hypothetical protein